MRISQKKILYYLSLFVGVSAFGFWNYQFPHQTFGLLRDIMSLPCYLWEYPLQTYNTVQDWFRTHASLVEENQFLNHKVHSIDYYKERLNRLEIENQSLRSLVHAIPKVQTSYQTQRALSLASRHSWSTLMITSSASVKKHSPVLNEKGVVGRVLDSHYLSASVLLITDVRSRIPAYIQRTQEHVIVSGNNTPYCDLLFEEDRIHHDVKKGDILLTSGLGGIYPPDLPLIAIEDVTLDGTVKSKPLVDFYTLHHLLVIDPVILLSPQEAAP
jgi:rod shape-determining protein MreC